jgi:UPF0042 nucleotide-binding protein
MRGPDHEFHIEEGDELRFRRTRARRDPRRRARRRDGTREIVLVTGISGSGKSIALHALEDAGFFCVDNLPPELLPEFLRLESERSVRRVAVAVDVRTAGSLPRLVPLLESLMNEGVKVRPVFLDASTDTLVRRFPRRAARIRCPRATSAPTRTAR